MRAKYGRFLYSRALYPLVRGCFAPGQVQELLDLTQVQLKSALAEVLEENRSDYNALGGPGRA